MFWKFCENCVIFNVFICECIMNNNFFVMEIESIKKVYVIVFYIIIMNKSMCREWFLKDD